MAQARIQPQFRGAREFFGGKDTNLEEGHLPQEPVAIANIFLHRLSESMTMLVCCSNLNCRLVSLQVKNSGLQRHRMLVAAAYTRCYAVLEISQQLFRWLSTARLIDSFFHRLQSNTTVSSSSTWNSLHVLRSFIWNRWEYNTTLVDDIRHSLYTWLQPLSNY